MGMQGAHGFELNVDKKPEPRAVASIHTKVRVGSLYFSRRCLEDDVRTQKRNLEATTGEITDKVREYIKFIELALVKGLQVGGVLASESLVLRENGFDSMNRLSLVHEMSRESFGQRLARILHKLPDSGESREVCHAL